MKHTATLLGLLAMCLLVVGCVSQADLFKALSGSGSPSLDDMGPLAKVEVTIWEPNGASTYTSSDPEYLAGLKRVTRIFPEEYLATPPISFADSRTEVRVFATSGESKWFCVQGDTLILDGGYYSDERTELIHRLSTYLQSVQNSRGVQITKEGKDGPNKSLQRNASTMSSSTIKSAVRHG